MRAGQAITRSGDLTGHGGTKQDKTDVPEIKDRGHNEQTHITKSTQVA